MPIVSKFPSGGGGGTGIALPAASNIETLTASEKVYVKWTDPTDIVLEGIAVASWAGTLLVRKAGSAPNSRRDGVIVLDSKIRNAYQDVYFCDSGLTNGVEYFYKLFPYTNSGTYTDTEANLFTVTPNAVAMGDVSGITTSPAGNGKLAITWTDPAATIETNGVTLATWANTILVVKEGDYATSPIDPDAVFTYTSTTRNGHATTPVIATGLTNGATYYITLFPMSTDGAVNTSAANRTTGTANRISILTVPSQSNSLTYNENPQSPSWNNYDSAQLVLDGIISSTNAGIYSATFTPKDDYMWADGSTAAKTVSWSIAKAAGNVSVSPASAVLNAENPMVVLRVDMEGDGVITAESSDESVAVVDASGGFPTVYAVANARGSATITVRVGEGTNHLAAEATMEVTAKFVPALNDCTWEQISEISASGLGPDYWNVGDRKAVTINGTVGTLAVNTTLYAYILGFDHNAAIEGKGIQFGTFKTALTDGTDVCLYNNEYYSSFSSKTLAMNHAKNTGGGEPNAYGGWKACDARYDILGSTNKAPSGYGSQKTTSAVGYDAPTNTATNPVANTLMAALPADLRAVMKPITKYSNNVNSSNAVTNASASVDYLPLPAWFEVRGTTNGIDDLKETAYQKQYDYYAAGNSFIKYKHNEISTTTKYYSRTAGPMSHDYSCSYFVMVRWDNGMEYGRAWMGGGMCPVFMV